MLYYLNNPKDYNICNLLKYKSLTVIVFKKSRYLKPKCFGKCFESKTVSE